MKKQSIKKGFTLIELLVVITIIGILATGGVSVFTTQLQGARDSTRISDMKLIETGIHQYFNDFSQYPGEANLMGSGGSIQGYLSKELSDPKKGDTICWNTSQNNVACGGYYNLGDDSFGLTNSAFKFGITFEKKVNMQNKAPGDGGTGSTSLYMFETFAGDGAEGFAVGTGGTAATGYTMSGATTSTSVY